MSFWKIGLGEIFSTIAGAVVGGVLTQFAFPAVTPYLDMWAYEYLDWTPATARFAVFADEGEVAKVTEPGDLLDVNRLFCGWSPKCVMRTVVFDATKPPSEWKLDTGPDAATKAVFITDWSGNLTAALIDKDTHAASYVQLSKRTANGFIGYGYGCYRLDKSSDTVFGRYYAYWGSLDEPIGEIKTGAALTDAAFDDQLRKMFLDKKTGGGAAATANASCPALPNPAPES